MDWYQYGITNPYGLAGGEANLGGHAGIDFGTPNRTPEFFPEGGRVIVSDYEPWGGQVAVLTNRNVIESFLHLDQMTVKPGDVVQANQVVGYSGGGVGDHLLGPNGQVIQVTDQSQWAGFSGGYHTHYAQTSGGSSIADDIQRYNVSLGHNQYRIDPTQYIAQLRSGATLEPISLLTNSVPSGSQNLGDIWSLLDPTGTLAKWAQGINDSITGTFTGITSIESQVAMQAEIMGVVLLALVFLLVGIWLIAKRGGGNADTQSNPTVFPGKGGGL
jgi:hypothetical protein